MIVVQASEVLSHAAAQLPPLLGLRLHTPTTLEHNVEERVGGSETSWIKAEDEAEMWALIQPLVETLCVLSGTLCVLSGTLLLSLYTLMFAYPRMHTCTHMYTRAHACLVSCARLQILRRDVCV